MKLPSKVKTFLKRNGFKGSRGWRLSKTRWQESHRTRLMYTYGYVERSDRNFRVRKESYVYGPTEFAEGAWIVDISCKREDFDRWANSCERTITLEDFMREFKK